MGNSPIGPKDSNNTPARPGNTTPKQVNKQNGDNGARTAVNVDGDNNKIQIVNLNISGATVIPTGVKGGALPGGDQLVRSSETPCIEKRQYAPANATDIAVSNEEKKNETCSTRQKRLVGNYPCGYEGIKKMDAARQAWRAENSGKTIGVDRQDVLLAKANKAAAIPSGKTVDAPAGLGEANTAKLQGLRNVFHEFWNNDGKCIKFIDMKNEIPAIAAYAKEHGISTEDVGKVFMQSVKEDTPFSMALMSRQWAQIAGSSAFKGNNSGDFTSFFNNFGTQIANGAIRDGGLKKGDVVASFEGKAENASFDNVLITVGEDGQALIKGLSTNADALKMSGRIFYDFDGNAGSGDVSSSTTTGSPNGAFGDNGTTPVPGQGAPVNQKQLETNIKSLKTEVEKLKMQAQLDDVKTPVLDKFASIGDLSLGDLKSLLSEVVSLKDRIPSQFKGLIGDIISNLTSLIGQKEGTAPLTPGGSPLPTSTKLDVGQLQKDILDYAKDSGTVVSNKLPPSVNNLDKASVSDLEQILKVIQESTANANFVKTKAGLIERLNALIQEKKVATLIKDVFDNDLLGVTSGDTANIRGKIITGAGESIDKLDSKGLGELLKNIEAYRTEAKNQGVSISESTNKKLDELTKLVRNKLADNLLNSLKVDLGVSKLSGNFTTPNLDKFSNVGSASVGDLNALKGELASIKGNDFIDAPTKLKIESILKELDKIISGLQSSETPPPPPGAFGPT